MDPTRIGRYEFLRLAAQTGMLRILSARDPELDRSIHIRIARFPEANRWVLNEARTLAALQHPEILPVYDIGTHDGFRYLTTEDLPRNLDSELQETSTPPPRDGVATLLSSVAKALDHVHRRGFVHRDVKPFHIQIDAMGRPRLSGFMVAAAIEKEPGEHVSEVAGSLPYMSPEQLRGERLGPQTDVWGLGVSLYHALTLKTPFRSGGESAVEIAQRIAKLNPTDPREIDASIPDELAAICLKCLSKDLSSRYPDCASVARDLEAWNRPKIATHRVFISHSSLDREFVESHVVSALEGNGIATWYSKAQIQTAAEWERSIIGGLESCDWFLVVVSKNSIASDWVKDELYWAIDSRPDHIIAVRADEHEPRDLHIRLARKQTVDFRSDLQAGKRALLACFQATKG